MEQAACDYEKSKDDNLYEKTCDDDLFSNVVELEGASGLNATAARLQGKGDDIATDKNLRNPFHRDQGLLLRFDRTYNACQDHVNGRSEESGCDQDQNGLDDEAAYAFGIVM